MKVEPQSHCHQCGTAYVRENPENEWPKRCPNDVCRNLQWFNPMPIGVLMQTVTDGERTGILTPIRGENPMRGYPAITGGYQEGWDQSSEDAGARELMEEIRLPKVDEDRIELLCSRSTGPFIPGKRQNLVFGVNPVPVHISEFEGWQPDKETLAINISWEPEVLAFPSHTYALAKYFQKYQGLDVPAQYMIQPRTGDMIKTANGILPIYNVPYHQNLVNQGIWIVEYEHEEELHIHHWRSF